MKCYTCHEIMKCIDDQNMEFYRADLFECQICKSTALVEYGNHGEYKTKVEWKRHLRMGDEEWRN